MAACSEVGRFEGGGRRIGRLQRPLKHGADIRRVQQLPTVRLYAWRNELPQTAPFAIEKPRAGAGGENGVLPARLASAAWTLGALCLVEAGPHLPGVVAARESDQRLGLYLADTLRG